MTAVPYWASDDGDVQLHLGDCLGVLRTLPADSVDAIVTDPPGAIAFMGRDWDDFQRSRARFVEWLSERLCEALRVLKPGGHALVWSLPRTSHWTAWAVEDAGFEVRDCVLHVFGSGFPKSLDVGKAIDRARNDRPDILRVTSWLAAAAEAGGIGRAQVDAHMGTSDMGGWWLSRLEHRCAVPTWEQWQQLRGLIGFGDEMDAEVWRLNGRKGTPGEAWEQREVLGERKQRANPDWPTSVAHSRGDVEVITAPATEDAARWDGWGTALKPGQEMWWLARKPLEGTVAGNVLRYGTGALNIAACRVDGVKDVPASPRRAPQGPAYSDLGNDPGTGSGWDPNMGRWPANLAFTHSAACEPAGTRQVRSHNPDNKTTDEGADGGVYGSYNRRSRVGHAVDGLETVEVWVCAADCPVGELDRQSGVSGGAYVGPNARVRNNGLGLGTTDRREGSSNAPDQYGDRGGASRFYPVFRYQAKAPASERPRLEDGTAHETVKPLGFISWAVRLVTPPGGTVLDMFAGSGPVAEACVIEGFRAVLIEQNVKSADLIRKRLSKPIQPVMFGLDAS